MNGLRRFVAISGLVVATVFPGWLMAADALRPDVAVVSELYADYAWEAVIDEPTSFRTGLLQQDRRNLGRYFADETTNAILRDRDCVQKSGGICALDFLPHWDSQDPSGATAKIVAGKALGEVIVTLTYHDSKRKLVYRVIQSNGGWRVSDIRSITSRWQLLKLLKWQKSARSGH